MLFCEKLNVGILIKNYYAIFRHNRTISKIDNAKNLLFMSIER